MNTVFVSKNLRKSKIKIFSKKKKKNSKKRLTRKVVCVKICRLSVETALKLEKRIDKQARKTHKSIFRFLPAVEKKSTVKEKETD